MPLVDWKHRIIAVALLWGALVGLLFDYAVFTDPGDRVGLWIAVLPGFGAVPTSHTRAGESAGVDTELGGT